MLSGVSHVHAPGMLSCDQVFFFSFLRKREREGGREGGRERDVGREGYDRGLQVPQPFIHSSG